MCVFVVKKEHVIQCNSVAEWCVFITFWTHWSSMTQGNKINQAFLWNLSFHEWMSIDFHWVPVLSVERIHFRSTDWCPWFLFWSIIHLINSQQMGFEGNRLCLLCWRLLINSDCSLAYLQPCEEWRFVYYCKAAEKRSGLCVLWH